MSSKKIGILEPDYFSEKAIKMLQEIGIVELFDGKDIISFLQNKEIVFVGLKYYIDKSILDNAPLLEFICSPTTGLTHLDLTEIKKKGIKVISLKGESNFLYKVRATPEHLFGLTLALLRNYKKCILSDNKKSWDRYNYIGEELFENKIGIIGFGRVGKILAKYFKCFGADVFFYDKNPGIREKYYARRLNSIKELILSTNIVLLCASYENEQVFNKYYIDMLDNKFFINGARGELIDEDYLIKKIEDNTLKGIALDVISDESKALNNLQRFIGLIEGRNFILTPHIAGATFKSMEKTQEFIVFNLVNTVILNK
jgi:D-3-phosphoglycerate dehydrogenase / 2-oxoglutarate reductase